MPFLIENVTIVTFVLFVLALLGNIILVGIVFLRRWRRETFFRRVDAIRNRYSPVVAGLLSGEIVYAQGLQELREISGPDRMFVLEQLCLHKKPSPVEEPVLRRLCEDLGLVKVWQQRLMGQVDQASLREALMNPQGLLRRVKLLHFLIRSKSAENLGLIRHEASWPLLVKALGDPNPDLQVVAVRALAAIQHPGSFPALVEQLKKVAVSAAPVLSVRTLKSALVNFPLHCAQELQPTLQHANPRIRFLATDIIREMVEREAEGNPNFWLDGRYMNDTMAETFLTRLSCDTNPDVRARAAPVIAYLPDQRAATTMFALLEDPLWFVRLHAARSLAKPRFLSYAARISHALTDADWRVRETAVRTLRTFGPAGLDLLTEHFLLTKDRYSREQIADEFQRGGLISDLLMRCFRNDGRRDMDVLRHLAEMGKTSYMIAVVENGKGNGDLRKKFLQQFGWYPDPRIHQWVKQVAAGEPDIELRALAQELLGSVRPEGER